MSSASGSSSEGAELANLVFAIAAINAWNRLNVATRVQPAGYSRPV